jgi:ABC-2 type transport system ATP-binding protein
MSVIEVEGLSKIYKTYDRREGVWGGVVDLFSREYRDFLAVDGISFSAEQGELIGYIGPNGAGKSTSIKMLTGILQPSSGSMEVYGYHPFKQRKQYTKHIGVVFGQRTQLWWDIAVIESFKLLAKIYEVDASALKRRLDILSDILELGPLLRTPVRKLSLGQRMKCDLAASLLHEPKVLFLDEPTIGLDAVAKDAIRHFLRQINQDFKTTIILTTHDLNEIEELCKRVILLDGGKILYDGSLRHVRSLPGLGRSLVIDFAGDAPLDEINRLFAGRAEFVQESQRRVKAVFIPDKISAAELIKSILEKYSIADLTISEPSIEQVIMRIYRDGLPDVGPAEQATNV